MNKLYIVLIIIFIICLFNLCNDLYEGHSFEDPHIDHGSCDCKPERIYNYRGSTGHKCHTRPGGGPRGNIFPLTSRDPRGGGENRDRVRDFCRRQENMNDCNNAIYPRASGITDWGGPSGTCEWTGEDTIYHPHSELEKTECFVGNCLWIYDGSLMEGLRVNINNDMKNNTTINRDTIINSPEFQNFLREENKKLSDFTGSSFTNVTTYERLTEEQIAILNNLPEDQRDYASRGSQTYRISENYVSVLVTGSDDPNDIGKIYKSKCNGPRSLNWSTCPREDDIYDQLINNNNIISLGSGRINPNYAYGVILYWQ